MKLSAEIRDRQSKPSELRAFPKQRERLPSEYQKIYEKHYKENRGGCTGASRLAQIMESWMHRRVAADTHSSLPPKSTLEIGAGTLNHLVYEPTSAPYDIIEPFAELYRFQSSVTRIRAIYRDVSDIPNHVRYERIISIATLEHICDLPRLVAKSALLMAPNAEFRVAIPSEGRWLWQLGWRLSTGLEFRLRYGLDYAVIMKHEHVNTAAEIESVLRSFFETVRVKVFGLSRSISLYEFLCCQQPNLSRCKDYLAATNGIN